MVLLSAIGDAFSNPDSPWYYVVGTAFLVLILAALAVYVIISGRKSKRDAQDPEKSVSDSEISDTTPPSGEQPEESQSDSAEQPAAEQEAAPEVKDEENVAAPVGEEKTEEVVEQPAAEEKKEETAEKRSETENSTVAEENPAEKEEKPTAAQKQPVKKTTTKSATVKSTTKSTTTKSAAAKSTTAKSTSKSTTAKKKPAQKGFIDRLIATAEAHAVYNELKNTILSYPGVKAKLSKEDETFSFGEEKKAKFALNGTNIELYLAVDKAAVPSQFDVEQVDGDLPTMLSVDEGRIDDAQRLIVFAMNVSMLTRNDKHRHVNYIQNAIKAKEKSATKK